MGFYSAVEWLLEKYRDPLDPDFHPEAFRK
jgi:hypothetical protein